MTRTRFTLTLASAILALAIGCATAPVPATLAPVPAGTTAPATLAPLPAPATLAPENSDGRAIAEDSDGWDCETMGNQVCGPVFIAVDGYGSAQVIDGHGRTIGTGGFSTTTRTIGTAHLPDTGDMPACSSAVDFQRVVIAVGILPSGQDATLPVAGDVPYPIDPTAPYATGAVLGSGGCILAYAYAGDVALD